MKEIQNYVLNVEITDQPNGTHHLILVVPNDMYADALKYTLSEEVVIGYGNLTNEGYDLIVESPHNQSYFSLPISKNSKTINWLDQIDAQLITETWVGYQSTGKSAGLTFYGLSIPTKS